MASEQSDCGIHLKLWELTLESSQRRNVHSKSILWAELALGKTMKDNNFFSHTNASRTLVSSESLEGLLKHRQLAPSL